MKKQKYGLRLLNLASNKLSKSGAGQVQQLLSATSCNVVLHGNPIEAHTFYSSPEYVDWGQEFLGKKQQQQSKEAPELPTKPPEQKPHRSSACAVQ
jgi:hypothetical protein